MSDNLNAIKAQQSALGRWLAGPFARWKESLHSTTRRFVLRAVAPGLLVAACAPQGATGDALDDLVLEDDLVVDEDTLGSDRTVAGDVGGSPDETGENPDETGEDPDETGEDPDDFPDEFPDDRPRLGCATGWDYFDDGIDDLFWVRPSDGKTGFWDLDHAPGDRAQVTESKELSGAIVPPGGHAGGIGDYDGDGDCDLVVRVPTNHTMQNQAWLFEDGRIVERLTLPDHADHSTYIAGLGDFDGDGKQDDIVFRDSDGGPSGRPMVWLMEDHRRMGSRALREEPSFAWEIYGVNDFDGDGDDDLLWRKDSDGDGEPDGEVGFWLVEDGEVEEIVLSIPISNQDWQIGATGDFNGDGTVDIAWFDRADGAAPEIWLMSAQHIGGRLGSAQEVIGGDQINFNWWIAGD